jgi:hypothetical protein
VRLGRFEAQTIGELIEMRDLISSSTLAAIPMSATRTIPQSGGPHHTSVLGNAAAMRD